MKEQTIKMYKEKFGLPKESFMFQNKVEDILKYPPAMVLIQAIDNTVLKVNESVRKVKKNEVICTTATTYDQLKKDQSGKLLFKPYRHFFQDYFNRYTGQNLNGKKLLVWRTGGLGDLLFIQSVIKQLRDKYSTAKITFASIEQNAVMLACWPRNLVNGVTFLPLSLDVIKQHDYHLTFEGVIERCKEAETENCFDLYNRIVGLQFDPKYNPTLIPDPILIEKQNIDIPKNTIAIQPRASSVLRTLSSEKIVELVNAIINRGYNVAMMDAYYNHLNIEKFIDTQKLDRNRVFNFAKYSHKINGGIAAISKCMGAITVDSSYSHIAPALGLPTITIHGSFTGDVRGKYYTNADWVGPGEWNECGRCPCFFHDDRLGLCPYYAIHKHPGCLESIDVNKVIDKFEELKNRMICA